MTGSPTITGDLRQSASAFTGRQRGFLDALRQTGLLRRELVHTPAVDWSQGRFAAARLAVADRAEAGALASLPALDTDSLRAAGQFLAQYDRAEAVRAEDLSRSGSQAVWAQKTRTFWDQPLTDEFDSIRTKLGLPSSL